MKHEAYTELREFRAERAEQARKARKELERLMNQRAEYEKALAEALLYEDLTERTRMEGRLETVDVEIQRVRAVVDYLDNGDDAEKERRYLEDAVRESNANVKELIEKLDESITAIETTNNTLWKRIEVYIAARKAVKEELARREGILTLAETKPYHAELKKTTQTGRITGLYVGHLPLVQTSDVFKRFGKAAR